MNIADTSRILRFALVVALSVIPRWSNAGYVRVYTEPYPAPPFTLYDLDNNAVSLSDYRGSATILVFWASW